MYTAPRPRLSAVFKETHDPADSWRMDTIAGARILRSRLEFAFRPDQAVMHGDRRATFIRMNAGGAVIRHWGDNRAVSVPLESLSLPVANRRYPGSR
jgi:hypothetical protein